MAVLSVFVRDTARKIKLYISNGQITVNLAKGIETEMLMTLTEIIADEFDSDSVYLVALSGPTHDEEVTIDMPITIVSSCKDLKVAKEVQVFFTSPFMRAYINTDVRRIEICGALKM